VRGLKLFATHARFLVWCASASTVLDVTFDRRTGAPVLEAVEELGGLAIQHVVGGGGRFGVVTCAGEAYVLGIGADGVERVDLGELGGSIEADGGEIEGIALGDEFEAVLCAGAVYGRGDSES
jgi:hypothetical protein